MDIGNFRLDVSRLPIVTVRYPAAPTPAEIGKVFDVFADLSRRGHPLAYVVDFLAFDPVLVPAVTRKAAADNYLAHAELLLKVTVCEARVVTSALSRGTLTAFDWRTGTKWPCANFATTAEADAWALRRLDREGAARLVGNRPAPRA